MCSYLHMEKRKVEGGEVQDWRITAGGYGAISFFCYVTKGDPPKKQSKHLVLQRLLRKQKTETVCTSVL